MVRLCVFFALVRVAFNLRRHLSLLENYSVDESFVCTAQTSTFRSSRSFAFFFCCCYGLLWSRARVCVPLHVCARSIPIEFLYGIYVAMLHVSIYHTLPHARRHHNAPIRWQKAHTHTHGHIDGFPSTGSRRSITSECTAHIAVGRDKNKMEFQVNFQSQRFGLRLRHSFRSNWAFFVAGLGWLRCTICKHGIFLPHI